MNGQFRILEKRTVLLLMLLGSAFLSCLIGCDRMTRYRVMTFFFEGVPSPDGKRSDIQSDPNIVSVTNVEKLKAMTSKKTVTPDKWGQRFSSSHDFVKDCVQCHMGDLRSGMQELRKPVPDLCYSCHTDLHQAGDLLHGPLNVGECLFCHDPHQSGYRHLQKAPQPDLCYLCHVQDDIVTIPGHLNQMEKICTDCHDPHGSSAPHFLKTGQRHEVSDAGPKQSQVPAEK